jgi:hypothetical protein
MYVGELEEILARHAYRSNWWVKTKSHYAGNRLPSGNATLFFGPPPPPEDCEDDWKMDKWFDAHGDHYNIGIPYLPEFTRKNERGKVLCRGWRHVLHQLIVSGHVRPDEELRKVLGDKGFDRARRSAAIKGVFV